MTKMDERIAALEARLRQLKMRQARMETRRRTLEARRSRRDDTRRKILVGALVLGRVERGELSSSALQGWLEQGLSRPEDRALFGLAPR